jgi:hypothetical protein
VWPIVDGEVRIHGRWHDYCSGYRSYRAHRGPDQIACRTPTLAEEVTPHPPTMTTLTLHSLADRRSADRLADFKLRLKL